MAVLDGKLLTLDMVLKVWGVNVGVKGTVEILDVSKRVTP
jgi:hypothetical protein